MEFRDAIKYLRGELGLTQLELASALHVNPVTVGRWESGKTLPPRSITASLMEFARARRASKPCLRLLEQSILAAAKLKRGQQGGALSAVEHATLCELVGEASFPLYVCDMETDELLYLNRKAEELLGCSLDELSSRKCYQCLMHRDTPCDACHKRELREDRFTCFDGVRLYDGVAYRVQGKRLRWNGRDAHVRYILPADLASLAESAAQLEVQRDRMDHMLNTAPSGIAVIELDPRDIRGSLRTTDYNDRFFSFSGYSREEYDALLKGNELGFIFEEDIPVLLADAQRICAGGLGTAETSMLRCRTKGGGYRWLLLTGQLTERRGSLCVITVAMVDVTPRKEAEDRLRINEELFRTAAETDRRTVVIYDVKAETFQVKSPNLYSARYDDILKNVPDSMIEAGIVAPESAADLRSLCARIRGGERKVTVSLSLRTGPQEYQWFECNAAAVLDGDGAPDHAILVLHNIMEQRVKEAVFQKWQNSINARAPESYTLFRCNLSKDASLDERDGELLKIRFSPEVCSMNARTEAYVSQYVYPDDQAAYTALLNSGTLLAMFYRGEHTASLEYREVGEDGAPAWRLLTVEMVEYLHSTDIQAFLLFEDIDQRKQAALKDLERAETDPLTGVLNRAAFTDKVDALLKREANGQHALLMLDMDGFKRLNDAFGHAAGDQALIDIAAVLRSLSRDGDLVCRLGGDEFLVWLRSIPYDAVIGKIAKQMTEQLCKAFSQEVALSASLGVAVYPRDGREFDGLYRSADRALYRVKQSGKSGYAFFSAGGRGQAGGGDAPPPAGEPSAGGTPADTGTSGAPAVAGAPTGVGDRSSFQAARGSARRRMLIVDDEQTSRTILIHLFQEEYLIETAKNGAEALVRLRHFGSAISVVLLDLRMPGMDGYEVLQRVQANVDLRTIPVVVVSGDEDRETLLKAIEAGAADYVTKPVDPELIRIRVRSAVSKAENERLRAQNSYLQLQRDEEVKFHTVLESTGTVVVEYDWRNHVFVYANDITRHIAGNYDHRSLWQVFLSDMVAGSDDVKAMQDGLIALAGARGESSFTKLVLLKTPAGEKHWFRVNIYKQADDFGLAEKMIITFNDVHEEVLSNEKLRFQATRDELTGLYNRAGFIEKAAELIAAREPGYYIMACIDIEKFKVINDQYGTDKGDEVLRQFAEALRQLHQGENGICCRVMADNFAVLYPARLAGSPELEASHRAVGRLDGTLPDIRFCAGRCLVDDKSLDISAIYDRAAIARDTIKGRYDVSVATYDESMRAAILRQQEITGQMKQALEDGQFEVWLQPQFHHGTGLISGAEALVRWRHPKEGVISPAEFIPVFEQNGFVYELDKFVWERTCALLRGWLDRGLQPPSVSVNVSRYDVFRDDVLDVIDGLLQKYSLPVSLLHLEITESAFTNSTDQIIRVVKQLVARGFVVEIDDFGSGYSSLNTLKDVPAQVLKLDMRFLENDENAQRGGSIIESVVRMANWLGMSVIAEGVETVEQADYLKSIGCENVQGYLYARPVPAADFERLLAEGHTEVVSDRPKALDSWNSSAFWNPSSMETLIFNSYVGGACIFEYCGGKTELLRANDGYAALFRQSFSYDHGATDRDILRVLDPGNRKRFAETIEKAIATRVEASCEMRLAGTDGTRLDIRVTLRLLAATGARALIYAVVHDITAQREAEQAERETAGRISAIMGSIDVGVAASVVKDGAVQYIFANDRYYELLGYDKAVYSAQFSGSFDAILPEDRDRVNGIIRQAAADGKPYRVEFRVLRGDGDIRWLFCNINIVTLPDIDGPVHLATVSDTTELHIARRQEEEKQKALLDGLACGLALYEYDGKRISVRHINKRYWELVEREPADYGDASVLDAIYPGDRAALLDEIGSAIRQKRVARADARILCGGGDYRPFRISAGIRLEAEGRYLLSVSYEPIYNRDTSLQDLLPIMLSTVMATSEDLSFIKDAEGRYLTCSKTAVAAFGLESERDILGKTSAEMFGSQVVRQFMHEDQLIYATGKPVLDRQIKLPLKSGSVAVFNTSKYPLLNGAGKVVGIYSICRDVTREKSTEFELQTLLRVIPSGVLKYSADEKAEFAYMNHSLIQSLGYTEEQFREKFHNRFTEMVWREDRAKVEAEIRAQESQGQIGRFDYRVEAADGQLHWFHDEGVLVTDETGRAWYYVTLVDITSQRKSEESLRLAEEEYRIATRHSGHTIGRYDIAARTLTITDDVATRLALPECIPDVPYGRVRLGRISEDTAGAYIAFYEDIMRGKKEGSVTFRKLLSIGWRWITEHATTIFDEEGKPVSAIISYKDVTEQQEKELAYKKWQQSIDGRDPKTYTLFRCNLNRNSTFDLWEGSLISVHFDDGLKTFNDRMAAFAAQCVHPDDRERYISFVNSDTMLAEYHRGHRADSLEYRETLPDGSVRWLRLSVELVESPNSTDVEAYLLYESIDERKRAELEAAHLAETDPLTGLLNRKAFSERVNAWLQKAGPSARHAFFMLDIDGFKLLNDTFGHAAGDEALIEVAHKLQALLRRDDLLGRLGGDEFVLFLPQLSDEADVEAKAEQICRRLSKAYSPALCLTASVGVSLFPRDGTDAHTLYERADTALYAAKERGRNTFQVYAQTLPEKRNGADPHEMDAAGGGPAAPRARKRRMLVVDGSESDRTLLKGLFDGEFLVDAAPDGMTALTRMRYFGSALSVVLLDLGLTGMSGLEVLEKAQASPEMRGVPILAVGVDGDSESCLRAIHSGAADYVLKPVQAELIRLRVASAISRAENQRLRAQNSFLLQQGEERLRYQTALGGLGMFVVELDWPGSFHYDAEISRSLKGVYDRRPLWRILSDDQVTGAEDAARLEDLLRALAEDLDRRRGVMELPLETAAGGTHRFRLYAEKTADRQGRPPKLILTFRDLDISPSPDKESNGQNEGAVIY